MTQAHRGSIIRPARMPVPLPSSAVLWPLMGDLINDHFEAPLLVGGPYSIRQEGPFDDGAIAFERSTTNLLAAATGSNADFSKGDLSGWSVQNQGAGEGGVAVRGEFTPIGTTYARLTAVDAVNDALFLVSGNFSLDPNTAYVVSGYARNNLRSTTNNGRGQIFILSNTGTNIQLNAGELAKGWDWRRFEFPFTTTADITGLNQYLRVDLDAPGTLDVTGLQVEAGTYGTSFVNGARASRGYFDIPIRRLNYWEGTISFWVKTSYRLPTASVNQSTFLTTGTNSLRMWKWNGNGAHSFVVDWNTNDGTRNATDLYHPNHSLHDWAHVTITWSGANRYMVYYNGQFVTSRSTASGKRFQPFDLNFLSVGGDCMMSDLVIDVHEWSPEMVRSIFDSQCRAYSSRLRNTILPVR